MGVLEVGWRSGVEGFGVKSWRFWSWRIGVGSFRVGWGNNIGQIFYQKNLRNGGVII